MKLDSEEILKCLCFVILGYFIAMMFSRMCSCGNRFRVGGQEGCNTERNRLDCEDNPNTCEWIQPPPVEFPWRCQLRENPPLI
jgi:hypothetical protein